MFRSVPRVEPRLLHLFPSTKLSINIFWYNTLTGSFFTEVMTINGCAELNMFISTCLCWFFLISEWLRIFPDWSSLQWIQSWTRLSLSPGGLYLSSIVQQNLITRFVPFLPLTRTHVERCIRAQLCQRGSCNRDDVVEAVGGDMTYDPAEGHYFSTTGCKAVAAKISFFLWAPAGRFWFHWEENASDPLSGRRIWTDDPMLMGYRREKLCEGRKQQEETNRSSRVWWLLPLLGLNQESCLPWRWQTEKLWSLQINPRNFWAPKVKNSKIWNFNSNLINFLQKIWKFLTLKSQEFVGKNV